nr:hypothetical protein [Tanacetum cinerariifolium]
MTRLTLLRLPRLATMVDKMVEGGLQVGAAEAVPLAIVVAVGAGHAVGEAPGGAGVVVAGRRVGERYGLAGGWAHRKLLAIEGLRAARTHKNAGF